MPSDTAKKRRNITQKIDLSIEEMTESYSRVCASRLDMRYPDGYQSDGSNKELIKFNNEMRRRLSELRIDYEYVTVREQADSDIHHYHSLFLTDGSKISKPKRLQEMANSIWKDAVNSDKDGLVNYPKHHPNHPLPALQMIKRPLRKAEGEVLQQQQDKFDTAKEIARKHGEYLAKEHSKGKSGKYREVFSSQVNKKKR